MFEFTSFSDVARTHAAAYPDMQAQDFIKLAYQHSRGCGHMVQLSPFIVNGIDAERPDDIPPLSFEDIGNGLVRAHLNRPTEDGPRFSSRLLARMFAYTAQTFSRTQPLSDALNTLQTLSNEAILPISGEEMHAALGAYIAAGCPSVHHSDTFRTSYHPAYRVIDSIFARYAALFEALEELSISKPGAIVAIDGMCASGKTTLSAAIAGVFDASVFHMDDFFLQPQMRTPERLQEPGGNVDRERFQSEVLSQLLHKQTFSYRPFDCSSMTLASPVQAKKSTLNIVEGAYSCHPALRDSYDMTVCILISPELQSSRILKRNGEKMHKRFLNEWIPMENRYLSAFDVPSRARFTYRHA